MGKGANRSGERSGPRPHGGKKGRKIGRNYRWDGVTHSVTKYRSRHGLPPGKHGAEGGPSRKMP